MGKVILTCGKICSGKSYYSRQLKEEYNAVIISPDEATYELLNNEHIYSFASFFKRCVISAETNDVRIIVFAH